MLRLCFLVILACVGSFLPSRACARVAETRTEVFLLATQNSRPESEPQVADLHLANPGCGYELASGSSQAAESEGISVSLGRYGGGYQTALDEFAAARNAPHFREWANMGLYDEGLPGWGSAFEQTMNKVVSSGGEIHFRLDGLNISEALGGDSSLWVGRYTAWELQQVTLNPTLLSRTTFYLEDAALSSEQLLKLGITK